LLVPDIEISGRGKGGAQTARGCCRSRFQQLIGDAGECAYHNQRLCVEPTANDLNQPVDGGGIFHRRSAELHDYQVFSLLESASRRQFGHISSISYSFGLGPKEKTHRESASGGGFRFCYEC
jgi:hypothetical protein